MGELVKHAVLDFTHNCPKLLGPRLSNLRCNSCCFAAMYLWCYATGALLQTLIVSAIPRSLHVPRLSSLPQRSRSDFAVNGSSLPEVDFDIGESYAGLLPISAKPNESRQLYFWYFPSRNHAASDEITIWLNGGPGASSLEGLLQENGPFLWQYGTWKPVQNPWSWVNLTNMIWIEQPVGTGFSQGIPSVITERDVAAQFMGFWRNFVDTFGLHHRKIFITGESYAGMYVPYLASAMLDANNSRYFNVEATMMYDPLLSNNAVMRQVPSLAFLNEWSNLLALNHSFQQELYAQARSCGYQGFLETHLKYPPAGRMPPPPGGSIDPQGECDIWGAIINAATVSNPCFNIYHITDSCPLPWDVLGFPGNTQYLPVGAPPVYFNRSDVQEQIHAPRVSWAEASPLNIYNTSDGVSTNYDSNQFPTLTDLLPGVIERTKRTVIGHGDLDFILIKNGTLLSIQNMTWCGSQGFRTPIKDDLVVPQHSNPQLATLAGTGFVGVTHTEKRLTFFEVKGSGHMSEPIQLPGDRNSLLTIHTVPQYAPAAAYRSLEYLVGRIPSLNSTLPFTT